MKIHKAHAVPVDLLFIRNTHLKRLNFLSFIYDPFRLFQREAIESNDQVIEYTFIHSKIFFKCLLDPCYLGQRYFD